MANTISNVSVSGTGTDNIIVIRLHIISDGSEESDYVVYDNSAYFNVPSKGRLLKVQASGSSCVCRLEWDQTTDYQIASFDPSNTQELCWKSFGGIQNPNGSGATGDILLTTANLDSGDEVTLFLYVRQG